MFNIIRSTQFQLIFSCNICHSDKIHILKCSHSSFHLCNNSNIDILHGFFFNANYTSGARRYFVGYEAYDNLFPFDTKVKKLTFEFECNLF